MLRLVSQVAMVGNHLSARSLREVDLEQAQAVIQTPYRAVQVAARPAEISIRPVAREVRGGQTLRRARRVVRAVRHRMGESAVQE